MGVLFFIMNTRELIEKYVDTKLTGREGLRQELTRFLEGMETDLNVAPASTRHNFHHAYEGGLVDHISEVITTAMDLVSGVGAGNSESVYDVSEEGIVLVGILHDIHKVRDVSGNRQYVPNILKSGSVSEAIPYKINEEYFNWEESKLIRDLESSQYLESNGECKGLLWFLKNEFEIKNGGVKSLMLVASEAPMVFEELFEDEVNAIRYHGGAYETSKYELQGKESNLQIIMHCADMLSSRNQRNSEET